MYADAMMRQHAVRFLAALGLTLPAVPAAAAVDHQRAATFRTTIRRDVELRQLVYLPPGYDADTTRAWPLILFLHGSGERGNELDRVATNGLPKELAAGREVPAVVLSPQCPAGVRWEGDLMVEALNALIDDALVRYRIDPRRVYLTGLSMGGFGAWALAAAHPDRFAAVAPVCGAGDPDLAFRMRRLPIWAFHGAKDTVVPVSATQEMADAMARVHGDMRTTIYPEAGHDSWSATYANPELYDWLFQHEKAAEPKIYSLSGATATASSGRASMAIDGDVTTRWESEWSDPQWLTIDLGATIAPRRLLLYWETAHGKRYDLLASEDGRTGWTTVAHVTDGDGAIDLIEFPTGFRTRYLKLDMRERGTMWGYSIWEVEVEME
ncbi:MAG TPA: alpha/beta fold hydrolase [Candidatus Eisenbacteria bacterium]